MNTRNKIRVKYILTITCILIMLIFIIPTPIETTQLDKEEKDCISTAQGEDTIVYLDEYVMWIGADGDTIWE